MTIGLLEDVQTLSLHAGFAPEYSRPHLGPRAAESWNPLNEFWTRLPEIAS